MLKCLTFFLSLFKKKYPKIVADINCRAVRKIHDIHFYVPNELCLWRGETIFKKEPATIEWINGFNHDDIFWDVGSNIGIYSLYAALKKGVQVYAFEPSPFNFYVMAKNIYLNKMSSKISSFCLALSDQTSLDYLNLKSINEGAAHTSFKGNQNEFGDVFDAQYSHATLGFQADNFVKIFNLKTPNHIKIDVDGAEKFVIDGATNILKDLALKSILIELTSSLKEQDKLVFDKIISNGFILKRQDHPDGDQRLCNYIFVRS